MYKIIFLVTALLAVPSATNGDVLTPEVQRILKNNQNLELVGTVEGKTYFAETTSPVTWTDASTVCTSSELSLARITDIDQYNLLISKSEILGHYAYWTAASAATLPSQYMWDTTTDFVLHGLFAADQVRSALTFRAISTSSGIFAGRDVTNIANVLCETML